MSINVTEEYPEIFFELKNLKICHYIQSWKATVLISNAMWYLQMTVWKKKNSFHWWGWLPGMRRTSILSTSTNLETWIKHWVLWKVEGVIGGGRVTFCQKHTLFSHQRTQHLVWQHTHIAKPDFAPKLCLERFINLTFCEDKQFISKFYAKEQ